MNNMSTFNPKTSLNTLLKGGVSISLSSIREEGDAVVIDLKITSPTQNDYIIPANELTRFVNFFSISSGFRYIFIAVAVGTNFAILRGFSARPSNNIKQFISDTEAYFSTQTT